MNEDETITLNKKQLAKDFARIVFATRMSPDNKAKMLMDLAEATFGRELKERENDGTDYGK